MVSEIRIFCKEFVEKYPNIKKEDERLDVDIIEKHFQDVVRYLNNGEPAKWDLIDIDIREFGKVKKSEHQGLGLIFFKKNGEVLMVCSGGYRDRSYLEKVEQEISDRPLDNGRVLISRLREENIEKPQSFIQSCECIVLKPKENISSVEMTVIVTAINALTNNVRFRLRDNYRKIVSEYMERKGWG